MDVVTLALSKKYAESLTQGKADLIDGKIPSSELPSYVDDVVEYATISDFPAEGESGKIYVALDTNLTYRWSGTTYIQIGGSGAQTYLPFPNTWVTDVNHTTNDFCTSIDNDATATVGMAYLGELRCSDIPTGLNTNIDAVVEIVNNGGNLGKVIHIICSSGDVAPYRWEYTWWNHGNQLSGWIAFQNQITSSNKLSADLVDDTNSSHKFVSESDKTTWNGKQDALSSGTNVKTINNNSIVGPGNVDIDYVTYLTTAPTQDNTDGLKFVVLSAEPATKYNGYLYIITRSE